MNHPHQGPAAIRGLDVERVRLPLERELAGHLAAHPVAAQLRATIVLPDPATVRRRLMGASLRLSEGMAPELHARARDVLRVLGIDRPLEIYQSGGRENAAIHLVESPILVEVQGRLVTLLDRGSMSAVLGHELGHYLAHGPWSPIGDPLRIANVLADADDVPEDVQRLASTLSMAMELTADRFGLLACQDLAAVLRLEMISTTGLPGDALTWDTDAYLAQCRELMEQCLREGSTALGVTHPEHNLRAYAAWLFSESTLYRQLTGKGPGTRSMEEIDALLARTLALPGLDTGYHMLDGPPPEVHACALACAVLVAAADGEVSDPEVEAIERVFAPLVPDFRAYFDPNVARARFEQLRSAMAALGSDAHRSLFTLLAHVIGADGVIESREVDCVLSIGDALGCGAMFRALMNALLRRLGLLGSIPHGAVAAPLPARHGEARAGLEAFLAGMAQRGGGDTTMRRLLRLLGERRRTPAAVATVREVIARTGLLCAADLESVELDAPISLSLARPRVESPPSVRRVPVDESTRRVVRGLVRLRDQLVSGDGRSPSVRLHVTRTGRSFDLHSLERISEGLSERVLATVRRGGNAVLVQASEAGSHPAAREASAQLVSLDRENRGRIEETGANDLALGYPFLTGNAGGYYVRGPLVLHPVDLERDERGARGFGLRPRKDREPVANQALLRLLFAKKGYAYPDELSQRLDELAADPQHGPEAILRELQQIGLAHVALTGTLRPLVDRREEVATWGPDRLEVEECAVLGLFPQSSSDLLQDYDALIQELSAGASAPTALGAAVELLPAEVRAAYAPMVPPLHVPVAEGALGVPVIAADPTQQAVIARAQTERALVVDGPPGTGKSQVIVSLVADAIGRGLRVAVVSEKRAAIDVVAQRLQQAGLSHAVALVHDVEEDRKPLYQTIAARLDAQPTTSFDAATAARVSTELAALTGALDSRARLLGARTDEGAPTLGNLHAYVSALDAPVLEELATLARLPHAHVSRAQTELAALRPFADLFTGDSPWRRGRASLAGADQAWLVGFERALQAANETALAFEHARTRAPGVDPASVARAASAIEAARTARALRAAPEDQAIFVQAIAVAERGHDVARPLAEAEAAWVEARAALERVGTRVTFDPGAPFEAAVRELRRYANRWWRFFSFAWWGARRRVRDALATAWPEQAGAPLGADLLDAILTRLAASRAWRAADACLDAFGLRHLAAPTPDAVTRLLGRVGHVYRSLAPLLSARAALLPIGAWLPRPSIDALPEWDANLEARVALVDAHDRHRAASSALLSVFPWLGELAERAHVEWLLGYFRRDAARVVEADRRLASFSSLHPDASSIFDVTVQRLGPTETRVWTDALARSWAWASIRAIEQRVPEVRTLDGPSPWGDDEAAAQRLATLLEQATQLERARIVHRVEQAPILRAPPAEKGRRRTAEQSAREAMLKECRKQRNVMPLRAFTRKFASEGLLDVMPVWLLSPETMAVLFPRQPCFDLVIFDEASQCTVENGLPAIVRAKRVVIAGDEKQMPPTSFFTARGPGDDEMVDDEDRKDARELFDAESLLTLARARVPHIGLAWHYRCLDEELIAFSNHAMYGGDLLTIPSTASRAAAPALRWVQVTGATWDKGRNDAEARRVVDLVHELLHRTPAPTIGVVTFNVTQRQAILDEIDRRRAEDRSFAERWDAAATSERLEERPFVKNLENVQGDERDVIVFSPAYAPVERTTRKGRELYVPARFGPLGQRGGERRLNVAISRAKKECIVVASFEPSMLSVARTTHVGPKLFRDFLEYAHLLSTGHRAQAERVLDRVREGGPARRTAAKFELPGYVPLKGQIALALQQWGIACELDVGSSSFRVDVAVVDRADPTRYRVGVLCDEGDASLGAFERHVHRPEVLRRRGYRVVRVTSRDWARDPQAVLRRIVSELGPADVAPASGVRREVRVERAGTFGS